MTQSAAPTDSFFKNSDLTLAEAITIVQDGLKGADYGEFYQEISRSESLAKDSGKYVGVAPGNHDSGFGFRVGQEDRVGYAFSDAFNKAALEDAVKKARAVLNGPSTAAPSTFGRTTQALYTADDPMGGLTLAEKIVKIDALDAYARALDPRVTNVSLSYGAASKDVHIITSDGQSLVDRRPMASLSIGITVTDENGKKETGSALIGGRVTCKDVFNEAAMQSAAKKALEQAKTLLIAQDAPAGIMDVVIGPGWGAIILHEAVGHGLEGDFNRRGSSVYSGKIGQHVAAPGVTVIDQGDLPGERGSLHFDDEGMPSQKNILIENGVLKGYMQDRQNAQLMNVVPTGNGRRQSYEHVPIPRMTNTYFAPGPHDPADIIASVKDGLYITDFSNGQVDTTSGKFNMNATLARRIRDGQLCEWIKGATLIGDGLTVIQSITMVGNDLKLDKSAGMCGKDGQSVPVGCGQPTIRVSNMTIGGPDTGQRPRP